MVGRVPEENERRTASRYETFIATFIALLAVSVAGYTAYMQRQQVRAAVWPILEFDSSNGPNVYFSVANKGVGPAIIRHVVMKVDGEPVRNWNEALEKLLGPGKHRYSESDISGHVFAPNETMTVFTPRDPEGNAIAFDKTNPLWIAMDKNRARLTTEICYSSTLGECWTLHAGGSLPPTITRTRRCPTSSANTFQQ